MLSDSNIATINDNIILKIDFVQSQIIVDLTMYTGLTLSYIGDNTLQSVRDLTNRFVY